MRPSYAGFTLIEIIIAVAIVAITAGIAYPIYTGYVSNSYHVEGMSNLHAIQAAQEEYAPDNNGAYFAGATTAALETASGNLWVAAPATEAARNYTYAVTLIGTTGYTATATGKGGKVPTSVVLTLTK